MFLSIMLHYELVDAPSVLLIQLVTFGIYCRCMFSIHEFSSEFTCYVALNHCTSRSHSFSPFATISILLLVYESNKETAIPHGHIPSVRYFFNTCSRNTVTIYFMIDC
jgi:hypothetical protein